MKKLASYFFQGLLYIAPVGVTIYVMSVAFLWIDHLLIDLPIFKDGIFSVISFPGMGILVIILFVTFFGFIGQKIITVPVSSAFDKLLQQAPLIKVIYSSVKDLLSAFVGKERKFDKPVLVKLDNSGIVERIGFITSTNLELLNIDDKIGVYFPSSYGLLGEFVIVPVTHVTEIDANSAEVMKHIVSGGISPIKKKEPHD